MAHMSFKEAMERFGDKIDFRALFESLLQELQKRHDADGQCTLHDGLETLAAAHRRWKLLGGIIGDMKRDVVKAAIELNSDLQKCRTCRGSGRESTDPQDPSSSCRVCKGAGLLSPEEVIAAAEKWGVARMYSASSEYKVDPEQFNWAQQCLEKKGGPPEPPRANSGGN